MPKLGVRRNTTYVIILKPDGSEVKRLQRPQTLESIAAFLDAVVGAGITVSIEYPDVGKLSADTMENIHVLATELLRTSTFNSAQHTEPFEGGIAQIQARYRKSLSGRYLVVTFDLPRNFKTIGGELTVEEIVIGLNHDDNVDSLFTIDIEGRVVEHAKYSVEKGIQLHDTVKSSIEKLNPRSK